jgi:hypothetical protein
MRGLSAALAATLVAALVAADQALQQSDGRGTSDLTTRTAEDEAGAYAGMQSCVSCHAKEAAMWEESSHGRHATAVAEPEGGADLAIGSSWMQAYMRRDRDGYHRIVPVCFDLRASDWRNVDDVLRELRGTPQPEEGDSQAPMHTAGRSFETDCSGCHASGANVRFEPGTTQMAASWRTAAIDCESCHGPGLAHAESWERLRGGVAMPRIERLSARARTGVCARCHGGPPTVGSYAPGDARYYIASVWGLTGRFSNGASAGQRYQAEDFRRSPCHTLGDLACADCHDPHGKGLRSPGHVDAMCTQCHEAQASRSHTHHDIQQAGGRCVSCHMPRLLKGVLAHQRDHRIGSPLPHAQDAPDACTACHDTKDKAWAVMHYDRWWPAPSNARINAVRGLHLARSGRNKEALPLLEPALELDDPFFRWLALEFLRRPAAGIDDPSEEVRIEALRVADNLGKQEVLLRLRADAEPTIRALAYEALVRRGVRTAVPLDELELALRQMRGSPGLRLALAEAHLEAGRTADAVRILENGVALIAGFAEGWILLGTAEARLGHEARAHHAWEQAGRRGNLVEHVASVVSRNIDIGRVPTARHVLAAGKRFMSSSTAGAGIERMQTLLEERFGRGGE